MTKRPSEILQDLLAQPSNTKLWDHYTWRGPTQSDVASWQAQGFGVYQGKVRTVLSRDGRLQLLHSDRLTAFDCLIDYVPLKGVILSAITDFWFKSLSGIVPTHFVKQQGPRALLVEALRPIKVEVVVRAYLAGAVARAYATGQRSFCGVTLPEGLKPFERLPEPIITPTTKAAVFEHDENISADDIVKQGLCSNSEWDQICVMALKIFSVGTNIFNSRGWILVDSKYEFGRSSDSVIKLIDEVHTPDSSRLWEHATYSDRIAAGLDPIMLDKENVRRYLMQQGFSGFGEVPAVPRALLIELAQTYLSVAEKLAGTPLTISD
jgi:phosphoribosylaminoimidazole-succinocarboxamide synthase